MKESNSKVVKEVKIDTTGSPSNSPAGPSAAAKAKGKMSAGPEDKTKKSQGQVDEVIVIMQGNIDKVVTRGEKINTLKDKTDALGSGGAHSLNEGTTTSEQKV